MLKPSYNYIGYYIYYRAATPVGPKPSPSATTGVNGHHDGGVDIGNANGDKWQNFVLMVDCSFCRKTQYCCT